MEKKYTCPVCGYKGLEEPPYNETWGGSYEICECCGFEYGYSEDNEVNLGFYVTPVHLYEAVFQLYRKKWVENGMKIFKPDKFPEELQKNGKLKADIIINQLKDLGVDLKNLDVDNFDFEE